MLTASVLVAALTAACGTTAARRAPVPTSGSGGASTRGTVADARLAATRGGDATRAYTLQVGDATLGLVTAVTALTADTAAGRTAAARADELTAQADYDAVRVLQPTNSTTAATVDELVGATVPGESFGGLHAVERDLWGSGPLAADVASLAGQTPVVRFLLSRLRPGPEAIASVVVDELDWVVDIALPVDQEQYSGLGLVDVAATEQAAARAYGAIATLAGSVDPGLAATVSARFAALDADVAALGPPTVVPEAAVGPAERLALSRQLDATASTLARLGAVLAPYGTGGLPS